MVTCHLDPTVPGRLVADSIRGNWIFVSRTLAHSLGRSRYVLNGIDPQEYQFSTVKKDYFLFIARAWTGGSQGTGRGFGARAKSGLPPRGRGHRKGASTVAEVASRCRAAGAEYMATCWRGESRPLRRRAGLLFPTQVNEAFGLAMRRTPCPARPVICSSHGACAELVTPEIGFVCRTEHDSAKPSSGQDVVSRSLP